MFIPLNQKLEMIKLNEKECRKSRWVENQASGTNSQVMGTKENFLKKVKNAAAVSMN